MEWWILGGMAWFACGIYDAGVTYAYFQREYPRIADEMRTRHVLVSLFMVIGGPISILSSFTAGTYGHGWLFPGSRP